MIAGDLSRLATNRDFSLFQRDIESHREKISAALEGKRVLVIGGAGSIGSALVKQILAYPLHSLHIIDINENNLTELVRDLRSGQDEFRIADFRTLPLDFGSAVLKRFLAAEPPYDFVLNFAAVKHVRSEKDVFSLLQMIDTNVVKTARLFQWLAEKGGTKSFFSVSTDKAANPVNLMGTSKRIMEHVLFSGEIVGSGQIQVSSARFANVAFSEGSLLQGFLKRLEKKQPLSVPQDTQRFFISLEEAAQICLLGALCSPDRHVVIPGSDSGVSLCDLESVAQAVLKHFGYEPYICDSEVEARRSMALEDLQGRYPLLVTPLNTSGEKPYEEFVAADEVTGDIGMKQLVGIPYRAAPPGSVGPFVQYIENVIGNPGIRVTKEELIREMQTVVPELHHIETGKSLDQRM